MVDDFVGEGRSYSTYFVPQLFKRKNTVSFVPFDWKMSSLSFSLYCSQGSKSHICESAEYSRESFRECLEDYVLLFKQIKFRLLFRLIRFVLKEEKW